MLVNSDGVLELLKKGDLLFVVVGFELLWVVILVLVQWLCKFDCNGVIFGGIDIGSVVLVEVGLFDGCCVILYWEVIDVFQEFYL